MASAVSAAIAVFAAIGFLVVVWCVVRLPFWIRDIRAEDREADRAFWAALKADPPADDWVSLEQPPNVVALPIDLDDWQAFPS